MVITEQLITQFEAYLLTHQRVSMNTLLNYRRDIRQLASYLGERDLSLEEVVNYQTHSAEQGRSARSRARALCAIRRFCHWLHEYRGAPLVDLRHLPGAKLERTVPRVCDTQQIRALLEIADTLPLRNRLIVYVLYSTGLRVSELAQLRAQDVQEEGPFLRVVGKGGKERVVPILPMLLSLIKEHRAGSTQSDFLFSGRTHAQPISRQTIWRLVKRLALAAGTPIELSPHTFRHSLATHSLQNGWDLRSLQLLLGHERLTTVQIYTHVDTTQLRTTYQKKHPRR